MRAIDNCPVEFLISLALVAATYRLATKLHMSDPIAVVVAGLLIGGRGPRDALSDETPRYLFGFWTLIDEVLNSVLLLLIGLEVLVVRFSSDLAWLGLIAVPLVLCGRFFAGGSGFGAAGGPFLRTRHDPGSDLGWIARRDIHRVGAFDPGSGGKVDYPRRHLRGGTLHHHRSGSGSAGPGRKCRQVRGA